MVDTKPLPDGCFEFWGCCYIYDDLVLCFGREPGHPKRVTHFTLALRFFIFKTAAMREITKGTPPQPFTIVCNFCGQMEEVVKTETMHLINYMKSEQGLDAGGKIVIFDYYAFLVCRNCSNCANLIVSSIKESGLSTAEVEQEIRSWSTLAHHRHKTIKRPLNPVLGEVVKFTFSAQGAE